jgi:hypothetical protein
MTVVLSPLYVYAQSAGLWWTSIIVLVVLLFGSIVINYLSLMNCMWVWNRCKGVPNEMSSNPEIKSEVIPIQSDLHKETA